MFKFKLESVLKYKIRLEEEAVKEFKLKKKEILECESRIENLKYEINKSKEKCKEKIDIKTLKLYENYLYRLEHNLKKEEETLLNLYNQLKIVENKMFEAKKDRKILENLKEKKFFEYIKDENLKEQKFLDEIASIAENRKKLN